MPRLLALVLTAAAAAPAPFAANAAEHPDVLFIAVDDLNHWVGYTGRNPQTKTPNIDRLSARGVSFTNAHCAVPACNPSRAALMTGLRPFVTGCYRNADSWKNHVEPGLGLSQAFRAGGYVARGSGKIYHGSQHYPSEWDAYKNQRNPSRRLGITKYEAFHEPLRHDIKDNDLGDWHTANYCITQLKNKHEKPLFLACGLFKPHLPFVVPRKYYDMFPLEEIELPPYQEGDLDDLPDSGVRMARPDFDHKRFLESGRWKAAIQSYLATVAYTDMNVGRLLDALDESGRADNTIIVLWGDHGWHFGEKHHWRKFALWEEATRAPLIWVAPGVTHAGKKCDAPIDFMTIYPTLCDLAGIETPEHVQGQSIRKLLSKPDTEWDGVALTTFDYENHAVRDARYRYIRYANGDEELYDHHIDPYEWTNIAGDPDQSDVKARLAAHMPKTAVPAPERKSKQQKADAQTKKKKRKQKEASA